MVQDITQNYKTMDARKLQEFTPDVLREQVNRFQELVYEYIKALSKLRKDQESFLKNIERREY